MDAQEAFDDYVESGRDIRRLSGEAVAALVAALDLTNALDVVAALETLLPPLVTEWGLVAATAGADYYAALRPAHLAKTKRVILPPDVSGLGRSIGWAVTPIFSETPDPPAMTTRLQEVTDTAVKTAGADSLLENAKADKAKPKVRRVAVGETCSWCSMLAARGYVYASEVTAGALDKWHAKCDCSYEFEW